MLHRSFWLTFVTVTLVAAAYLWLIGHPTWWNAVISPQSFAKSGYPFVDMQGHLAASQAFAEGRLVPGQPVPGDPFGRQHAGPGWMLWLGLAGLKAADYIGFAGACLAGFLIASAWLLRPAGLADAVIIGSCLLSPSILLLVERGNVELLIFAVLTAAFSLLASGTATRQWLGWGIVAAFVGFKYYPALGFAGVLETIGPRRRRMVQLALGLLVTLAFVLWTLAEIRSVAGLQAVNRYFPFFGARELFILAGHSRDGATGLAALSWLALAGALAGALGPVHETERRHDVRKIPFLGGGAILSFCFIATTSPDYRTVHFLFCLPWLIFLARHPSIPRLMRWAAQTSVALFLVSPWCGVLGSQAAVMLDLSASWWWLVVLVKQTGWWFFTLMLGALVIRQICIRLRELLAQVFGRSEEPV